MPFTPDNQQNDQQAGFSPDAQQVEQNPTINTMKTDNPEQNKASFGVVLSSVSTLLDKIESFANKLSDLRIGAAKDVGSTAVNLGEMGVKALDYGSKKMFGQKLDSTQLLKPLEEKLKPTTTMQKAGGIIGDIGMLATPTKLVAGAKALGAISMAEKIPLVGRVLRAIPEAVVGFGYGKLKGESSEEAFGTATTFGTLSVGGEIVGDIWRAARGSLSENITKALGIVGKMDIKQAINKIPQATNAFKIIKNLAPDIKVIDESGVEKTFNPVEATYYETSQAWLKARDSIYNAYTQLAGQAGDKGAVFAIKDFKTVINSLKLEAKDATAAFRSRATSLINDLETNFSKTTKDGIIFTDTSLKRMQNFIEKVNTDINPASDKAGSRVSAALSQKIREIMDDKILSTTGEEYQKLRNGYRDLKSIETDLVNQWKKAARGSRGFASYVEGYGVLDAIISAFSHRPIETAKGLGLTALGAVMKFLRNPENNLKSAFKQLEETSSPLRERILGK